MTSVRKRRTTREYKCGECGARPGEQCRWPAWGVSGITTCDEQTLRVYHRDRERRFIRSVNRQTAT